MRMKLEKGMIRHFCDVYCELYLMDKIKILGIKNLIIIKLKIKSCIIVIFTVSDVYPTGRW